MELSKLASRNSVFPLFIAASLLVGWYIPHFYTWTDSNQSRPSPLLWKVPMWSMVASVLFSMALRWLPIAPKLSTDTSRVKVRFSLRMLMVITTAVAIATALLAKFPVATSGVICAGAYGYFIAFCVRNPQHRMASAALLACMILPYAWVVGYKELDRILPTFVIMLSGMPALVPAALIGQLLGQNMRDVNWLMYLLTAVELAMGIMMIRLGPKRTIACLLLVMHLSALGSLVFHMLCLA